MCGKIPMGTCDRDQELLRQTAGVLARYQSRSWPRSRCGARRINAPAQLDSLYFTVRQFPKPPKSIYIFFQDRITNQRVRSNVVTIP